MIGDTFGVSASSYAIGGFVPRATATASGASTNAADAPAGVGALTVKVTGVGANYAEQYGTVTLSGVTGQALGATATGTWMGINKVAINTCGASGKNVGAVFLLLVFLLLN